MLRFQKLYVQVKQSLSLQVNTDLFQLMHAKTKFILS
jgi:hypothetical protein